MTEDGLVETDLSNPPPRRIDRSRMGKGRLLDIEPWLVVTKKDLEETRRLAREEKEWPPLRRGGDAAE